MGMAPYGLIYTPARCTGSTPDPDDWGTQSWQEADWVHATLARLSGCEDRLRSAFWRRAWGELTSAEHVDLVMPVAEEEYQRQCERDVKWWDAQVWHRRQEWAPVGDKAWGFAAECQERDRAARLAARVAPRLPIRLQAHGRRTGVSAAVRGMPVTYIGQRQRWVKIGQTSDVAARMQVLRTACGGCVIPAEMDVSVPLVLVATFAGLEWEGVLHEHYAEVQAAGEWFHAAAVLDDLTGLIRVGAEVTWWS